MSVMGRLYRGDTKIDFIGVRRRWYIASAIIIAVCLGSMLFRGFNFGIEFAGGNQFLMPAASGTSLNEVRSAAEELTTVASAQEKGRGKDKKYVIRTAELTDEARTNLKTALAKAAKTPEDEISVSNVSSSWGSAVTEKALMGLVVFLFVVAIYLWIRYERKMAWAALFALLHDLLLTAGVYSLSGFEVTPGTVIGLLTILGYSLYDTVVVFDKVDENTKGLLGHNRYTYPEAANMAVNQTLMRSINTSLVALLPVGGLLFVGAGILGVGTLKDLALVLFVGMLTGAYSSLFLATPWLVDLKMMDQRFKLHAQRVVGRRVALAKGEDPDRRAARAARTAKAGRPAGPESNGTRAADADAEADQGDQAPASTSRTQVRKTSAKKRPAGRRR